MDSLNVIIKAALIPGSISFLLLGLVAGGILLFRPDPWRTWGRYLVAVLTAAYWLLSLPVVAFAIEDAFVGGIRSITSADQARGANAVVVLDGGTSRFRARGDGIDLLNRTSAFRTLEAIRVSRLLGNPLVVVTAGDLAAQDLRSQEGVAIRDAMVAAGIPTDRILVDSNSPNTRAHATTVKALLAQRGINRIVLVTAATHIRRSVWAFQAAGFDVIASPAVGHSPQHASLSDWWPSWEALRLSEDAARDAMAIAYYGMRGWL